MIVLEKKEKVEENICTNKNGHNITDFHDYKNDCCTICHKVFNKETGEFSGYYDMEIQ